MAMDAQTRVLGRDRDRSSLRVGRRRERTLIRAAQRGSEEALEELFRRHWRAAHRAAYLVVHDGAAAEDIAQEAFIAAIRTLDRFDRRRPFGPWLHRIVVNRAIDWSRARKARREVSGETAEGFDAVAPRRGSREPRRLRPGRRGCCARSALNSARWWSCATCSSTRRARSPSCWRSRAGRSTRDCAAGSTRSRARCREDAAMSRARRRAGPGRAPRDAGTRRGPGRGARVAGRARGVRRARAAGRARSARARAPRSPLVGAGADRRVRAHAPPGADVREWIADAIDVGEEDARPVLGSLPAPGSVLVESREGAWVLHEDGSRRRLGDYDARDLVAERPLRRCRAKGRELFALDPAGDVRGGGSLPPRRSDRSTGRTDEGYRVAYVAGEELHVVAGDGTGDVTLDDAVDARAIAWRPETSPTRAVHELAYVDADNRVTVVDTDSAAGAAGAPERLPRRWSRSNGRPTATGCSWSQRSFALTFEGDGTTAFKGPIASGFSEATLSPDGETDRCGAAGQGGRYRAEAAPVRAGEGSESACSTRAAPTSGSSTFGAPTFSPDGEWILLPWPEADQWLFIRIADRRVVPIADISRQLDADGRGATVVPRGRRLVLLKSTTGTCWIRGLRRSRSTRPIIAGWPARSRATSSRCSRRRRPNRPRVTSWAFEIKWDGVRAPAFVDGIRAPDHQPPRRGHEPPLPRAGGDGGGARRPRGGPGRRGRRVRREGPAELPDAAAADGAVAARDDPPPSAGGPGHLRRLRPAGARRRSRCSPSPTSAAASCWPALGLDAESLARAGAPRRRRPRRSSRPPGRRVSRESSASGSAARTGPGARSRDWLKIRARLGQELVIGGYMPGEGGRTRPGRVAPRRLLGRDARGSREPRPAQRLVYAGGVGTGFTDAMLERLIGLLEPLRIARVAVRAGRGPAREVQGRGPASAARARCGWTRCSSASSSSPSGRARGRCASRRSRASATTRTRARSCGRPERGHAGDTGAPPSCPPPTARAETTPSAAPAQDPLRVMGPGRVTALLWGT